MESDVRKYRVIEAVGRGGFGIVYRAELIGTGGFTKSVALKVLTPEPLGPRKRVQSADIAGGARAIRSASGTRKMSRSIGDRLRERS